MTDHRFNATAKILEITSVLLLAGSLVGCSGTIQPIPHIGETAPAAEETAAEVSEDTEEETEEVVTEEIEDEEAAEETEEAAEKPAAVSAPAPAPAAEEVPATSTVFGSAWCITSDSEDFYSYTAENGAVVANYIGDNCAGTSLVSVIDTGYANINDAMKDICANHDLGTPVETKVAGRDALTAVKVTEPSEGSGLSFTTSFTALDNAGKVVVIEETMTNNPDPAANEAVWNKLNSVVNSIEFEEPEADYPSNPIEERIGKTSFSSQQEIISSLQPGECYAYANILGASEPVLLIADSYFTPEPGLNEVMNCYAYLPGADGRYTCATLLSTISTGTPIAVSNTGLVYCATHTSMTELCVSADTSAFMVMKYLYLEFSDNGSTETYGGFVRSTNTVIGNDGVAVAANDSAPFEQAFAEYDTICTPVNFTVVK